MPKKKSIPQVTKFDKRVRSISHAWAENYASDIANSVFRDVLKIDKRTFELWLSTTLPGDLVAFAERVRVMQLEDNEEILRLGAISDSQRNIAAAATRNEKSEKNKFHDWIRRNSDEITGTNREIAAAYKAATGACIELSSLEMYLTPSRAGNLLTIIRSNRLNRRT